MQIRQGEAILLEQGLPTYTYMEQFGPVLAPSEPCTGLFKRIEYDWSAFGSSDINGQVDEWIWLYWQPMPVTVTLTVSDTGQVWDAEQQAWYWLLDDGSLVETETYTYSRSFEWQRWRLIYLPLVMKNAGP